AGLSISDQARSRSGLFCPPDSHGSGRVSKDNARFCVYVFDMPAIACILLPTVTHRWRGRWTLLHTTSQTTALGPLTIASPTAVSCWDRSSRHVSALYL